VTTFVLDNSVTMRWFFDSGTHTYADAILADLRSFASDATVPVLWRYETSAVLAREQNRGLVPAQDIAIFMGDLSALPITVDADSSDRIYPDVHQLAVTHRLTSYDAAYLELALRRGLPLATLDAELIAACAGAGVRVL
jgi:predicted nucleic acid-binding protein